MPLPKIFYKFQTNTKKSADKTSAQGVQNEAADFKFIGFKKSMGGGIAIPLLLAALLTMILSCSDGGSGGSSYSGSSSGDVAGSYKGAYTIGGSTYTDLTLSGSSTSGTATLSGSSASALSGTYSSSGRAATLELTLIFNISGTSTTFTMSIDFSGDEKTVEVKDRNGSLIGVASSGKSVVAVYKDSGETTIFYSDYTKIDFCDSDTEVDTDTTWEPISGTPSSEGATFWVGDPGSAHAEICIIKKGTDNNLYLCMISSPSGYKNGTKEMSEIQNEDNFYEGTFESPYTRFKKKQ